MCVECVTVAIVLAKQYCASIISRLTHKARCHSCKLSVFRSNYLIGTVRWFDVDLNGSHCAWAFFFFEWACPIRQLIVYTSVQMFWWFHVHHTRTNQIEIVSISIEDMSCNGVTEQMPNANVEWTGIFKWIDAFTITLSQSTNRSIWLTLLPTQQTFRISITLLIASSHPRILAFDESPIFPMRFRLFSQLDVELSSPSMSGL